YFFTDPNPGFAGMLQQVLEETRRFKVKIVASGGEVVEAVHREAYDLAILDYSLEDKTVPEVVATLRSYRPALAIIAILPFGQHEVPDADLDVQGLLSKPFYIPELESQIDEALGRPVGGILPPPREKLTAPLPRSGPARAPTPAGSGATPPPARRPAPPPPAWLQDVNRAAQYLTTLTLEASAEAALLMRGQQLIAYAGQFGREGAEELARVVADNWARDGGGGQSAQARFIRLASGADYLVYSTLAAADVVLSMAFQAETPLGMIRKKAKRATEALFSTTPGAASPPVETMESERVDAGPMETSDLPNEWIPKDIRTAAPQPELAPPPVLAQPGAPPPAFAPPSASPLDYRPASAAMPDVRRTPHGLYALSYTFLFIPRFPQTKLIGDIKEHLESWMTHLALIHDWRITSLMIAPDHIEVSIDCAPSEAPEKVVKALMHSTAEKVMAEFPRLANEHASRAASFWALGFYVVAPGRRLSADEIARFVEYERGEQGFAST
ncbi:MAG: IS200/IS605 family transposase, partial [Chloroflexota bacterium]